MSAMKPIYLIFAEENHGGWVEASKLQYDKTCEDDRWMLHSDCEDWLTAHDAKVRDDAIKEIHNAVVRLFSAAKEKS